VYGAEGVLCNVMCHGFLFADVVSEPGRLGCSKWPLVGLFDCTDGISHDKFGETEAVPTAVGENALNPSDQHVHLVDEYGEMWHIGASAT
jgi:hypothetical protein